MVAMKIKKCETLEGINKVLVGSTAVRIRNFGKFLFFRPVDKARLQENKIGAMLNELSSTVVFERPKDEEFVRRWQLACEGNIAHVVVMPSVTIEKLDYFLKELVEKRASWFGEGEKMACIGKDVGVENCFCGAH